MARPRKSQMAGEVSGNVSMDTNTEKENKVVDNELINKLLQKIEQLEKKVESQDAGNKTVNKQDQLFFDEDEDEENIRISPDAYIKVMSLSPYQLNLSIDGRGTKPHSFMEFGDTKRIVYSDLVQIVESHKRFMKDGLFYIMSKKAIRKLGLNSIYDGLLTKEMIEKIVYHSTGEDNFSLFASATDQQKDTIIRLMIDKMVNDGKVDLNVVDKLSRISGINIQEKYQAAKEVKDAIEENGN